MSIWNQQKSRKAQALGVGAFVAMAAATLLWMGGYFA